MPHDDSLPRISNLAKRLLDAGFNPDDDGDAISKSEALLWAASEGLTEFAEQLLTVGVDVNARGGDDDATAMHFAAEAGSIDIMRRLLSASTSLVSAQAGDGRYALHFAAINDELDAMLLLLDAGADINSQADDGRTALHAAAQHGLRATIEFLLDHGADIHAKTSKGHSPLHLAIIEEEPEVVQLLIDRGADVSRRSGKGWTPLIVSTRSPDMVQRLLDAGADPLTTDDNGLSPLIHAAAHDAPDTIELLLKRPDVDIDQRDNFGRTALGAAIPSGYTDVVRLLLRHGASYSTRDNRGQQPLHVAAKSGQREIVSILIDVGADLEARDNTGHTPLLLAVLMEQAGTVQILVDRGADLAAEDDQGGSALHLALDFDNTRLVRFFLFQGVDIESPAGGTYGPLASAVMAGSAESVSLLLRHGANVDASASDGYTVMHIAAEYGDEDIVRTLLKYGPDLTCRNDDGDLAMDVAVENGHDDIVKLLIEASTIIGGTTKSDSATINTGMLVSAAERGNLARVRQLLDKGVDIDGTDVDGRRALSSAARNGHKTVVEALIERNVDIQLADTKGGETALWWASRNGYLGLVQRLLSEGAHVEETDDNGQSPLSAAAQSGHIGVVKLLLEKGCSPDNSVAYGKTALLFAASAGHLDVVDALLRAGADVNYHYTDPRSLDARVVVTALSLAIENGHDDLAKRLLGTKDTLPQPSMKEKMTTPRTLETNDDALSDGVDDEMTKYGQDLLAAATCGRVPEMLRLLRVGASLEGPLASKAPILAAAEAGQFEAVKLLLEKGVKVDRADGEGRSALSLASAHGHTAIVKLLYEAGSAIDGRDRQARTALSHACRRGREETVRLLIDLGADTEAEDCEGKPPLLHAIDGVGGGHTPIVRLLLERGISIRCMDMLGCTPVNLASKCGRLDIVRLLLERGAGMETETATETPPLSHAAEGGFENIVELLLTYKADINHQNGLGRTALHYAVKGEHSMVVKILIEAGADVNIRDMFGQTPLSLAKESGHEACVRLLSRAATIYQMRNLTSGSIKTSAQRNMYRYRPLPEEGYIRILELYPGRPGDILAIELHNAKLTSKTMFEALSYTWGEKVGNIPIQCGGNDRILVTPNCKAAMQRLRLPTEPRFLWIDAICINQTDFPERNRQVAMMTDIYQSASQVLMWLGDESEHYPTDAAFASMQAMASVHRILRRDPEETSLRLHPLHDNADALSITQRTMEEGQPGVASAYEDLLWRQYFTRGWIFQEIILAGSRGIVYCGRHECPWRTFKAALLAYSHYRHPLHQHRHNPSFARISGQDQRFAQDGTVSLVMVVNAMSNFDTTDPRDKIFASMGLAKLGKPAMTANRLLAVDYSLSTNQVFINAARFFIGEDSLFIIWDYHNRQSTKTVQDLPSWVPDFTQKQVGMRLFPFQEDPRFDYSELIDGRPSTTSTTLAINGCLLDEVAFRWTLTRRNDVLSIIIPMIQALADMGKTLFDLYDVHNVNDPKSAPQRTILEVLWSTILQPPEEEDDEDDEDEDAEMMAYIMWKLCHSPEGPKLFRKEDLPQDIESRMVSWETKSQGRLDFDLDICRRMEQRVRYGMDLVLTDKGHLGITNGGEAQKNMSIMLIGGFDRLALMQKKTAAGIDGTQTGYEYVDEIYLKGLATGVTSLEQLDSSLRVTRLEIH